MNKEQISNRLIHEKSPYLLQHAYNPIAWQPWDNYAFNRSRQENKPIFLSIGYSTCHWCHLMKRESFEDLEVAELLNAHFIPIKVDREERPDIDQIYMTVCQALTGQGGWPLTIILTPERQPFFAGTYLPKHSRLGRPGLLETLSEAHLLWSTNRDSLIQSSQLLTQEVQFAPRSVATNKTPLEIATRAYNRLKRSFNQKYGGFGSAPKFPSPHNLLFLMRYWKKIGTDSAQAMALKTLQAIYRGGINDHIGFGFARYAADHKWLTPHFEKMLCDNAMLAIAFLEAGQAIQEMSIKEELNDKGFNNENFYTEEANRIFTYLLRDMAHPEGGFYSAQDAESEDIEGKFYIWRPREVYDVLGSTDGSLFCRIYDITEKGNFAGQNIPNLIGADFAGIAKELNMEPKVLAELLEDSRQKLFIYREERVHPFKDDKILTSWNGLTIAALARGAAQLGDARLLAAALKGERFLRNYLCRSDGRLLACYRDGKANLLGYLDDYAYTIWGLLELYRATFFSDYLSRAVDLAFAAKDLFWDAKQGGFFFCGADAEQLIARPKEIYDHALPSGNSVMAVNLMHLASLTGNSVLSDLSDRQINAFIGLAAAHPENMTYFMNALLSAGGLGGKIVVTGTVEDPQVMDMLHLIRQKCFCSDVPLIYYPEGAGSTEERARVESLAPYIKNMPSIDNKATAYVCRNKTCNAPVTAMEDLIKLL